MMFHVPLILTPREREPIYASLSLSLALVNGAVIHHDHTIIITRFISLGIIISKLSQIVHLTNVPFHGSHCPSIHCPREANDRD